MQCRPDPRSRSPSSFTIAYINCPMATLMFVLTPTFFLPPPPPKLASHSHSHDEIALFDTSCRHWHCQRSDANLRQKRSKLSPAPPIPNIPIEHLTHTVHVQVMCVSAVNQANSTTQYTLTVKQSQVGWMAMLVSITLPRPVYLPLTHLQQWLWLADGQHPNRRDVARLVHWQGCSFTTTDFTIHSAFSRFQSQPRRFSSPVQDVGHIFSNESVLRDSQCVGVAYHHLGLLPDSTFKPVRFGQFLQPA